MRCSICLSTHNKAGLLEKTLESIFNQKPSFEFEVNVVDDNSEDSTFEVLLRYFGNSYPINIHTIKREKAYQSPAKPRNISYKMASGDIVIAQSDDVIHTDGAIQKLVDRLEEGQFRIAQVYNYDFVNNRRGICYTGTKNKRPLFFLGSMWRRDIFKVGGNCERFIAPAKEDTWFGNCLIDGLGLKCIYDDNVIGYHQNHARHSDLWQRVQPSEILYKELMAEAAKTGIYRGDEPWKYVEGKSFYEVENEKVSE